MNERYFSKLVGHDPFPWQQALYAKFVAETSDNIPEVVFIPTGLGKTSVIAVWLLARLEQPSRLPRRLVYVVNRRTVVDQTTVEVNKYRENVKELDESDRLRTLVEQLGVSTLRGQMADNHEWSSDPSNPAVICGTVDMIGSRLLFSGYRIGFKSRPLHAGFLGQDALLVHDEAHLEPAFQELIQTIEAEQKRERKRNGNLLWPGLRVMALSATARAASENADVFGLTDDDREHSVVKKRLNATKTLHLHECGDEKEEVSKKIAELAAKHEGKKAAVLIFVRKLDDIDKVVKELKKTDESRNIPCDRIMTLTGTMRGLERDNLVKDNNVFARFLPLRDPPDGVTSAEDEDSVYLVCTSAGEVGVNLSADHMVCDLSTLDSMIQRFGRVNRFGDRDDTCVDVVHPHEFGDKKDDPHRDATLKFLQGLNGDASPASLGESMRSLTDEERKAAFAPMPNILPATDILLDAWAMTTIREKMPGRPPVAPYLHGVADWEPARTTVAWRNEVELITGELIEREGEDFPRELLTDYPIKPHELLNDRTARVLDALQKLAADNPKSPVWVIDDQQQIHVSNLEKIANPKATKAPEKRQLERDIAEGIVLLSPSVGGLSSGGMLDPKSAQADDVADKWFDEEDGEKKPRRQRKYSADPKPPDGPEGMALIRTIDTDPFAEERVSLDDDSEIPTDHHRYWHWYARPRDAEQATFASTIPITLEHHTRDVVLKAKQIVADLDLPDDLKQAVTIAAELHDLGKQRDIWQRSIGNPNPSDPSERYAKPGKPVGGPRWRPRPISDYRHEFGSLLDVLDANGQYATKLARLGDEMGDLILHLIAAHHGYARPHFPPDAYDHECYNTKENHDAAHEAMRRFARLQRRYGRWGLAYLESLLRAADWAASAEPTVPDAKVGGAL
jgi:CRISPR-associated endonuclease/helicase Cas3